MYLHVYTHIYTCIHFMYIGLHIYQDSYLCISIHTYLHKYTHTISMSANIQTYGLKYVEIEHSINIMISYPVSIL